MTLERIQASWMPCNGSSATREPETTQIYLRRLEKEKQLERVRDLSWGARFGAIAVEAPSGVEPL